MHTETGDAVQGRAVLVVDDDDDIRDAVQDVLQSEGYATVGASNGKEALDLLRTSSILPALVLLDLMMPEMDGWELLASMDEDPALHRVPVALMSAHPGIRRAFDKERTQGQPLQSSLLLPKPLNLLRLLSLVHDAVRGPDERAGDPKH
jgi:CheY-like chemotaxis protein